MENVPMLKKIVCLLSCQPRDLDSQLPGALSCLCKSVGLLSAGIFWPDAEGQVRLHAQYPQDYQPPPTTRDALGFFAKMHEPSWGKCEVSWLAVPMKITGQAIGRLWAIRPLERDFGRDEREFLMMAANQLALAVENARLHDEVLHLAARRGELLRRVIATQDERCRRVSRELHDEISQSLTAMALDLEAAEVTGRLSDVPSIARLGNLRARLLSALDEVNRIILDLRPTLLEDMGLVPALRWYAHQRLEPAGVGLRVQAIGIEARLHPHIETTLYRIAQEAITNAAKHAHAQTLWLIVQRTNEHFELSVKDDGLGFDVERVVSDPDDRIGLGLFGMKERATLAGGTFEIHSARGQGTCVSVRIPMELEAGTDANPGIAG